MSALVRAVGLRAARESTDASAWIRARDRSGSAPAAADSLFAMDLAASLACLRRTQAQTLQIASQLDSAANRNGAWVTAWSNWQIQPDPQVLASLVPWAVVPANLSVWNRVVQATGDQALALEGTVPDSLRAKVPTGSAHILLAETIGALFTPDSLAATTTSATALDTLLARLAPQGAELLAQTRPDAWPLIAVDSTTLPSPLVPYPVAKLLIIAIRGQVRSSATIQDVFIAPDASRWIADNWTDFSSSQAAHDTLAALVARHPELKLATSSLK